MLIADLSFNNLHLVQEAVTLKDLLLNPLLADDRSAPEWMKVLFNLALLLSPLSFYALAKTNGLKKLWPNWIVFSGFVLLCAVSVLASNHPVHSLLRFSLGAMAASLGIATAFTLLHLIAFPFFLWNWFSQPEGQNSKESFLMLKYETIVVALLAFSLIHYANVKPLVKNARARDTETLVFNPGDTLQTAVNRGDSIKLSSEDKFSFIIRDGKWKSDTLTALEKDYLDCEYKDVVPHSGSIVVFGSTSTQRVICQIKRKDTRDFTDAGKLDLCVAAIYVGIAKSDTLTLSSNYPFGYELGTRSGRVPANTAITLYSYAEDYQVEPELRIEPFGAINQRIVVRGGFRFIEFYVFGYLSMLAWFAYVMISFLYYGFKTAWPAEFQKVQELFLSDQLTKPMIHSNVNSRVFGSTNQAPNQSMTSDQTMDEIERRADALMSQLQTALQPKGIWDHYQSVKQSRRSTENLAEMSKLFSTMAEAINSASNVITAQNSFEVAQIKRSNLKEIALLQAEVDKLKLQADIVEQKARATRHEDEIRKQPSPPPPSQDHSKSSAEMHRERIIEEFTQRNLRQDLEIKSVTKAAQDLAELKKQLIALDMPEGDVEAIIDNLKNRLLDQE